MLFDNCLGLCNLIYFYKLTNSLLHLNNCIVNVIPYFNFRNHKLSVLSGTQLRSNWLGTVQIHKLHLAFKDALQRRICKWTLRKCWSQAYLIWNMSCITFGSWRHQVWWKTGLNYSAEKNQTQSTDSNRLLSTNWHQFCEEWYRRKVFQWALCMIKNGNGTKAFCFVWVT